MARYIYNSQNLRIGCQHISLLDVRQLLLQVLEFVLEFLFLENVLDRKLKGFLFERLGKIVGGSHLHCFHNRLDLPYPGKNDNGYGVVRFFKGLQNVQSIHSGEQNIEQDD